MYAPLWDNSNSVSLFDSIEYKLVEEGLAHPRGSSIWDLRSELSLIQISMIFQLTSDVGNVGKEMNKLKTHTQHWLGIVGPPYSSFYHVNKAHGTLWAGQFPSRHLGQIQLPCILGPQWGMYFRASVLIYLEWQLKGHQGPHLMTATITRVQDGGENLNLAPYISMGKISPRDPSRHVYVIIQGFGVLQLTVALTLQHVFAFPGRKHASCSSPTFDSLKSVTAHQLKRAKGGKKKKIHQRDTALKLTAVIVLCHLVCLPWNRKGLIFYDVW